MLTRLEIDGFKSFEELVLEVPPLLAVVGTNASGKSNLFDAILLLGRTASFDLRTALTGLRGEVPELFRRGANGVPGTKIRLAAELLLNPQVRDPWGGQVELSHTRARYELDIERRPDDRGIERIVVTREKASPILRSDDPWRKRQRISKSFQERHLLSNNRKTAWLETEGERFEIHHDGHAGRSRPAQAAEATVLSSITSVEFPHLFAIREELRSWRLLQLDPATLRRPSVKTAPAMLEPDGSNIATVLARIMAETKSADRPKGLLSEIAADLERLIPGVLDLSVAEDEARREYRVDLELRNAGAFSARVVSDGTLRLLALLTQLHDPLHSGLVCFEEPENGVHPARLKALVELLRELVSDPAAEEVGTEPLSQLLVTSHSPVVVAALDDREMVFSDLVSVTNPTSRQVHQRTRLRPVKRTELFGETGAVTSYEVKRYLESAQPPA